MSRENPSVRWRLLEQTLEDIAAKAGNNGCTCSSHTYFVGTFCACACISAPETIFSVNCAATETRIRWHMPSDGDVRAHRHIAAHAAGCTTIGNVSRYFWQRQCQWQLAVSSHRQNLFSKFIVQCNCNFQLLFSIKLASRRTVSFASILHLSGTLFSIARVYVVSHCSPWHRLRHMHFYARYTLRSFQFDYRQPSQSEKKQRQIE